MSSEENQNARESFERAIALNSNNPYNYSFHVGQAHYTLGSYGAAITAFEQVLESNPAAKRAHLWPAAAYARVGRIDDAEWELGQVLAEQPDLSLEVIRDTYPLVNPADLGNLFDGLRTAGMSP